MASSEQHLRGIERCAVQEAGKLYNPLTDRCIGRAQARALIDQGKLRLIGSGVLLPAEPPEAVEPSEAVSQPPEKAQNHIIIVSACNHRPPETESESQSSESGSESGERGRGQHKKRRKRRRHKRRRRKHKKKNIIDSSSS